jgi:hypothetical protein
MPHTTHPPTPSAIYHGFLLALPYRDAVCGLVRTMLKFEGDMWTTRTNVYWSAWMDEWCMIGLNLGLVEERPGASITRVEPLFGRQLDVHCSISFPIA